MDWKIWSDQPSGINLGIIGLKFWKFQQKLHGFGCKFGLSEKNQFLWAQILIHFYDQFLHSRALKWKFQKFSTEFNPKINPES